VHGQGAGDALRAAVLAEVAREGAQQFHRPRRAVGGESPEHLAGEGPGGVGVGDLEQQPVDAEVVEAQHAPRPAEAAGHGEGAAGLVVGRREVGR